MSTNEDRLPWENEGDNYNSTEEEVQKQTTPYAGRLVNTGTEPIVVFFGPREVGKTVALLRMVDYLSKFGFTFPISSAVPKGEPFDSSKRAFQKSMDLMGEKKPQRTKEVDFLMLDVAQEGELKWHILEAPGEHFFDRQQPEKSSYPRYMQQIFDSPQKKVFVLFFTEGMFEDISLRKAYSRRLSTLINRYMNPKKDKIVLLYNKIDESGHWSRGQVDTKRIKKQLLDSREYEELRNAIMQNAKGLKHTPLVPFYSGTFYEEDGVWSPSEDRYIKAFYDAVHGSLTSRRSWRFW